MAKKKVVKKAVGKTCGSGCCSVSCWLGIIVSEAALYLFFVYLLYLLAVPVLWTSSLILLALINVMFFACPFFRKHFM